ncbi:scoloptoxin SSD14-like isoform X2 [Periplaneta americana]
MAYWRQRIEGTSFIGVRYKPLSRPVRTGISRKTVVFVGVVAIICAVAIGLGLYFGLRDNDESSGRQEPYSPPSVPDSELGVYWNAAVATNGYPCAIIGRDILMKNGSAVEATIATLFCEGVVCLQSMGLGGGFLMTIYKRDTGRAEVLNARETAPIAANKTMFKGNSTLSMFGGLSVAVPGELLGYWEAYQRYKSGNVEWSELVQPTIDLCREGITVSAYLESKLKESEEDIKRSPTLSEILINPATKTVWKEGDKFKRLKLADTLEIIRDGGASVLYNGTLTDRFVKDIQDLGGIITIEDMNEYRVKWSEPIEATLTNNIKMYTVPPPGSGALLALALNILEDVMPAKDNVTTYQRITEAFKYTYGKRTQLGDPDFVPISQLIKQITSEAYAAEIRKNLSDCTTWQNASHYGGDFVFSEDHGTAHISVLAPNGDAVSVTSTVNQLFGSMARSLSTGIILNDEMDDFSAPNITNGFGLPPSPSNYIEPGKRPMSSMVPAIFVDGDGEVQLVTGGSGGTKITSATALVVMEVLWFNKNIKEAIDAPRVHHQLFPMSFQYEDRIPQDVVEGMKNIGHVTQLMKSTGSSVTGIARKGQKIYANSDFRRGGMTAGF